ncbi:hypothetical protein BJ875DRAFT_535554 [Amylocarpus encephaloides]|uniref:C2H2-type domain-containing protein n=1 Tax=Amylocarpus encephaloides TaxID=45428 RepID=A0A9P7YFT5_9HELO|nr:hypothetical protein BJ875DRAFT_535554 [Amylocarpus encephaloides]
MTSCCVYEEALQQHLRDLPAHVPSFDCDDCDRSFDSEEALQQHLRDSLAHTPSFDCETCDRSFSNEEALEQHLRDSRIHQQDTETPIETPLDVFFRSFPTFDYDPSLPLATSYANLQRHEGWRRGSAESDDTELYLWYGTENDLTTWYALCRVIGVEPLPRTHVNIVDLIKWGRSGSEEKVHTFRNIVELRSYTKETQGEGGNVVLRHLLRKIFRESL